MVRLPPTACFVYTAWTLKSMSPFDRGPALAVSAFTMAIALCWAGSTQEILEPHGYSIYPGTLPRSIRDDARCKLSAGSRGIFFVRFHLIGS